MTFHLDALLSVIDNREFQVRWGDKHGGYGEHYWDYNHAGHVSALLLSPSNYDLTPNTLLQL
jgi:hypothetical protein